MEFVILFLIDLLASARFDDAFAMLIVRLTVFAVLVALALGLQNRELADQEQTDE